MVNRENINQYDLVEIIEVPGEYEGVIDVGDVGVVVNKYDDHSFQIECTQPGGSYKWFETLSRNYVRLKSKDPFRTWKKKPRPDPSITKPSVSLGANVGTIFGVLIGGGLGAITESFNGILIGMTLGLLLGIVTGAITAVLTVRTAGRTGGVGVGYFTGMVFGGGFGFLLGALIPASLRVTAHTEGLPLLDALMMGRFETAALTGFLLSILATMVGVWVGGKNFDSKSSDL